MNEFNNNNMKNFTMTLFNGSINKELRAVFGYKYVLNSPDGKYKSVRMTDRGTIILNHSYSLTINQTYDVMGIFIPGKDWERFCVLLDKTVKLISDNLYELFPNVDSSEFDIDSRTLDRFKTEKACSSAGMSMYPDIWVSKESQTYPAIQINTTFGQCTSLKIPLEDAIPLNSLLKKVDPIQYGLGIIEAMESIR